MNDSLRTNVFVRFSPETIACACIFLAARQLKVCNAQVHSVMSCLNHHELPGVDNSPSEASLV